MSKLLTSSAAADSGRCRRGEKGTCVMSEHAVVADGLRKAYGEGQALDGLSLTVETGSVLGLLGPNGSGKTTTVSILATSLRPDSGHATVGGLDVVRQGAEGRRVIGPGGAVWARGGH